MTLSFLMPSLHFLNAVSLTHSGGRELMLNSSFTMKWYVEITSNIMSVCVCKHERYGGHGQYDCYYAGQDISRILEIIK